MNALHATLALSLLSLSACLVDPADAGSPQACTTMGCADGLKVDFSYNQKGNYLVVVTIDGVITTCKATLPLANPPPEACDRPGVYLTLVGSALPADQQSIGGVFTAPSTAKHITVNVSRDGTVLGTIDKDITWVVTAGPNGPDCEPKQCRTAQMTL